MVAGLRHRRRAVAGGRGPRGDGGLLRIDGNQLTVTNHSEVITYEWALRGDQLSLRLVKECDAPGGECLTRDEVKDGDATVLLVMEHTFSKSGDDASF
jgi:hypothetical protein